MARRRNNRREARNDLSIANQRLLRTILSKPTPIIIRPDPPRQMALAQLDRRAWKPDITVRAPGAIQRKHARLTDQRNKIAFAVPNKVAICVRRKTRREVLFAKRKTRKGSGANKTRNFWSDVKC